MMTLETVGAAEAAPHASPSNAQPDQTSPCAAVPRPPMPSHDGDQRYHEKLARVLARMGGIYTLDDLLTRIRDGRMQSFAHRNSWLITQINCFPRAKTLDWIAAVGDLEDWRPIHDHALRFASEHDISLIRAYGRRGWMPTIRDHGWKTLTVNQVYQKEL